MLKSYDDFNSKGATSFSSEQSIFAFTPRTSNCNFTTHSPTANGCQTKVLSQDVRSAASFPQFSGSRCQELPGVAKVSSTSPAHQLSNSQENCRNLPNIPVPPESKGRSPPWKTKANYRPGQTTDPEALSVSKSKGESNCNPRPLLPRRAGTRCLSRPRPARATRSHCELGPIILGYSPNSGYPRILCLPSIRRMAVRFLYFPLLQHRVRRRRRRRCPRRCRCRRLQEPVSRQPSCPSAAEQDGIEEA